MDVKELSKDQLQELREDYFYLIENNYSCIDEIPDKVIFNYYVDFSFTNSDFTCTSGKDWF